MKPKDFSNLLTRTFVFLFKLYAKMISIQMTKETNIIKFANIHSIKQKAFEIINFIK